VKEDPITREDTTDLKVEIMNVDHTTNLQEMTVEEDTGIILTGIIRTDPTTEKVATTGPIITTGKEEIATMEVTEKEDTTASRMGTTTMTVRTEEEEILMAIAREDMTDR
jgi:hypothetical protein